MIRIEEAVNQFFDLEDSHGLYIQKMFEIYGLEEVYSGIKALVNSKRIERFENGVEFLSFIYNNTVFIPGTNDRLFIEMCEKNRLMDTVYSRFRERRSYSHLLVLYCNFSVIENEYTVDNIRKLIHDAAQTEPLLVLILFDNLCTLQGDSSFYHSDFPNLQYKNRVYEFFCKYNLLSSRIIDPFQKYELVQKLEEITPKKYRECVCIQREYYGRLREAVVVPDSEEETLDVLDSDLMTYYTFCSDNYEKGIESYTFDDYLRTLHLA